MRKKSKEIRLLLLHFYFRVEFSVCIIIMIQIGKCPTSSLKQESLHYYILICLRGRILHQRGWSRTILELGDEHSNHHTSQYGFKQLLVCDSSCWIQIYLMKTYSQKMIQSLHKSDSVCHPPFLIPSSMTVVMSVSHLGITSLPLLCGANTEPLIVWLFLVNMCSINRLLQNSLNPTFIITTCCPLLSCWLARFMF